MKCYCYNDEEDYDDDDDGQQIKRKKKKQNTNNYKRSSNFNLYNPVAPSHIANSMCVCVCVRCIYVYNL